MPICAGKCWFWYCIRHLLDMLCRERSELLKAACAPQAAKQGRQIDVEEQHRKLEQIDQHLRDAFQAGGMGEVCISYTV